MKRLLPALPLALFAVQVHASAPKVIPAPVDHLYVPAGFDNNDNVEVVVTGTFPSTCYSRNKVDVAVREDVVEITVTALERTDKAPACAQVLIPFQENVTIGNLQAGEYRLVVNGGGVSGLEDKMSVVEARSSSMDDYIYAIVDYIELGFTGGIDGSAELVGQLPSPCFALDRVEYLSNGKDTLSIMPIMKQLSDFCPMKMVPMRIPVKFDPAAFNSAKILLFSRTTDGKSVNTLVLK